MKKVSKRKKGITLIEAIISVALLSILVVPISEIVINSFKTNKNAEIKQNAAYIGQKTLEELKSYDNILLKDFSGNKKGFLMLDGQEIYEEAIDNFEGSFINEELGEEFIVEVKISKNGNFTYESSKDMDLILELSDNKLGEIAIDSLTDKKIRMVIGMDQYIHVFNGSIELYKEELNNRNILINISNSFRIDNFNIEVENKSNNLLTIYKNKEEKGNDITINVLEGKVSEKAYDEVNKSNIGDLYNINVAVKRHGEELFSGTTSNNIVIRN